MGKLEMEPKKILFTSNLCPNKTEHWHFGENFYFPFLICV